MNWYYGPAHMSVPTFLTLTLCLHQYNVSCMMYYSIIIVQYFCVSSWESSAGITASSPEFGSFLPVGCHTLPPLLYLMSQPHLLLQPISIQQ